MEYPQVSDSDLRRLTDGEAFPYAEPDTGTCHGCKTHWVKISYLLELLTDLGESCITEPKQDVYTGLRNIIKGWRDGRD